MIRALPSYTSELIHIQGDKQNFIVSNSVFVVDETVFALQFNVRKPVVKTLE